MKAKAPPVPNYRRFTLTAGHAAEINRRAHKEGRQRRVVLAEIIELGLRADAEPALDPTTPFERRVRFLMREEGLSREAAEAIAEAGGHADS